jgi:hypothetical protein
VLGDDIDPGRGRLVVNEEEGECVRAIFALFEEHRSVLQPIDGNRAAVLAAEELDS